MNWRRDKEDVERIERLDRFFFILEYNSKVGLFILKKIKFLFLYLGIIYLLIKG